MMITKRRGVSSVPIVTNDAHNGSASSSESSSPYLVGGPVIIRSSSSAIKPPRREEYGSSDSASLKPPRERSPTVEPRSISGKRPRSAANKPMTEITEVKNNDSTAFVPTRSLSKTPPASPRALGHAPMLRRKSGSTPGLFVPEEKKSSSSTKADEAPESPGGKNSIVSFDGMTKSIVEETALTSPASSLIGSSGAGGGGTTFIKSRVRLKDDISEGLVGPRGKKIKLSETLLSEAKIADDSSLHSVKTPKTDRGDRTRSGKSEKFGSNTSSRTKSGTVSARLAPRESLEKELKSDIVKNAYQHARTYRAQLTFKDKVAEAISNLTTMQQPSPIVNDFMYLGNKEDAANKKKLLSLGISHILNAASGQVECFYPKDFIYKSINILDAEGVMISSHFFEAIQFIMEAKSMGGRILVHCIAGVSRSPSFIMAYLMKVEKWDLHTAYEHLKKRRFLVHPNESFRLQLAKFELELNGLSTVADPKTSGPDWNFKAWNMMKGKVGKIKPKANGGCVIM